MKKISGKDISWVFFSFMTALLTALLVMAAILSSTLFSSDYMLQRMEETAYYENTAAVLRRDYAAYSGGLDDDFFETAIDEEQLFRDIRKSTQAAYNGVSYTPDKQALIDTLYQKMEAYALQKGLTLTKEDKTGLRGLASHYIGQKYLPLANQPILREVGRTAHSLQSYLWMAMAVLAALIGLCLWMIYRLRAPYPHRAIRAWGSGFSGAAVMLLGFPSWLYLSEGVNRLAVTSAALKSLAVSYINNILTATIITGGVLLGLVLTVGIIVEHILKKRFAG